MRRHRFFIDQAVQQGPVTIQDPDLSHQLIHVLRLRIGDEVILADRRGFEALATVAAVGRAAVAFQIGMPSANRREPDTKVTAYVAILKRENFELVVQKMTELGVSRIVPILTERTVKLDVRDDRLEKIAKEAAEQSGRATIPEIAEPISFDAALGDAAGNRQNFIFHTAGDTSAHPLQMTGKDIGIFIGPEGGFTEEEVGRAVSAGCQLVVLGALTFRAETAAIVAATLVLYRASTS